MRVLWVGDAVVSSGFARCTHAACDALHAAGHEVHVLGLNYFGDPHRYPYPIYPCRNPLEGGHDGFGVTRLPHLVAQLRPDVVVLLNDPWNIPSYLETLVGALPPSIPMPPVVGWLAVDGENQAGAPLNRLARVAVWTEFAARELVRGGYSGQPAVVPLGVDLSVFYPRDPAESRTMVLPEGHPAGGFIFGAVGRNQPRKRLDLTIQYFAEWYEAAGRPEDAWLYLHVGPTGDIGCDIRSIARYYRIANRVILAEPPMGTGYENTIMPMVYSALDAYITTSQGEGWGLPCLEAMACGVPCLVPDWSGLGDWTGDAAVKVACSSRALSAPLNGQAYTVGGIADRASFVKEMNDLYRSPLHRMAMSVRGRRRAAQLPWGAAGAGFLKLLEGMMEERAAANAVTGAPAVAEEVPG